MTRAAILLAALVGLTACETMSGFGRDVERAGDTIEDTAQETQSQM